MKAPKIISRAAARKKGLRYYFTGQPCQHGGIAPRYVSTAHCTCDACRQIRNEKSRAYALENPDKIREHRLAFKRRHSANNAGGEA